MVRTLALDNWVKYMSGAALSLVSVFVSSRLTGVLPVTQSLHLRLLGSFFLWFFEYASAGLARLHLEHVRSMAGVVSKALCLIVLVFTFSSLPNGVEFSFTSVGGEGKRMAVESTKGADADRRGGATNDGG